MAPPSACYNAHLLLPLLVQLQMAALSWLAAAKACPVTCPPFTSTAGCGLEHRREGVSCRDAWCWPERANSLCEPSLCEPFNSHADRTCSWVRDVEAAMLGTTSSLSNVTPPKQDKQVSLGQLCPLQGSS